jgi:LacI family transcriptional regulator, repressor for deo operon, udp, cdd, tsx, nupC, and nupG
MVQIDRNSSTPIYRQIYDDINMRIQQGEYSVGRMLPSENKLCAMYGVERATIRRALDLMLTDGKIEKIPGLGTSLVGTESNNGARNKTLLFLLPKGIHNADRISEPFNAKLMDAMEHECLSRGYDLLYKSYKKNATAEDLIRTCNPCGVFFTSSLPVELYRALHHKGIPAVLVNQSHPVYPSVCLDNRGGAKMVMDYLFALGHRDIGFLCGASGDQIQSSRFNGYREALESNGVIINADWILEGDWSMESGKAAMQRLLKRDSRPTALFAANDSMAIGAMMEALDSGLAVPGDISIVGFDNIDQSAYVRPALTTVAVDYQAMSRAACMLMFDMVDHESSELNVNIYIPLHFIDRESTMKMEPVKMRQGQ